MLWALTFVAPLVVPELTPTAIAGLRYAAFGTVAAALLHRHRAAHGLLMRDRPEFCHWRRAVLHAVTGHLTPYVLTITAVRVAGAPIAVSVIALLPIVYSLIAARVEDGVATRPAARLPIGLTALGILTLNLAVLQGADAPAFGDVLLGTALAAGSGASWLWYAFDNRRHVLQSGVAASQWTNTVGVVSGVIGIPVLAFGLANSGEAHLGGLLTVALVLGVGSSWLATAGFTYASARLPRGTVGPLMGLEPVWSLTFAQLVTGTAADPVQVIGQALLMVGAATSLVGLRSRSQNPIRSHHVAASPISAARGAV